ncbi:hypothetical protein J725_4326 [Acinetobacter baumannii 1195185_80]|nr:hypothetical protein J725_4326 [Acinetobacter baumannii 1195185_80]
MVNLTTLKFIKHDKAEVFEQIFVREQLKIARNNPKTTLAV